MSSMISQTQKKIPHQVGETFWGIASSYDAFFGLVIVLEELFKPIADNERSYISRNYLDDLDKVIHDFTTFQKRKGLNDDTNILQRKLGLIKGLLNFLGAMHCQDL